MKGGKRPGAGRKPSEPTERVRVPVGCLDEVKAIIERHKLKHVPEIRREGPPPGPDTRDMFEEPDSNSGPEIKEARKALERLPKAVQRQIRKDHGTLTAAAIAGVRADGKRALGER